MAPNYYQLIDMAPRIREAVITDTMCLPDEVRVEFSVSHDELQKINRFFFEKTNPEGDPKEIHEVDTMNVKLCGIEFTYKARKEGDEDVGKI